MMSLRSLSNGEPPLLSLDEAARRLRVSPGTLRARLDHGVQRRARGARAMRYLTQTQLERIGRDVARFRSRGLLSLDEAASLLEVSEEKVLGYVASSELQETDPGSAFFARDQVELLYYRRRGLVDLIPLSHVVKLGLGPFSAAYQWFRRGLLGGVQVGGRHFVSRGALEAQIALRVRTRERVRLLRRTGRFLTPEKASEFLGVHPASLYGLVHRGLLKPITVRQDQRRFYRRRDLERVKLARASQRAPPPNTLGYRDVRRELGVSVGVVNALIRDGRLRLAAQRETGKTIIKGYDPKEVARIKAERKRRAALVTTRGASEILGISLYTVSRLVRKGLLAPRDRIGPSPLFEPKDVIRLKDDPSMAGEWRRARTISKTLRQAKRRAEASLKQPGWRAGQVGASQAGGVLSEKEAAKYLGVSVNALRDYAAQGRLGRGRSDQGFLRTRLDLLLLQREGIEDPVPVKRAMRAMPGADRWVKGGWLKAVRIGRSVLVSKSGVEAEARKRERLRARLRLLCEAGRLLTQAQAADLLGVCVDTLLYQCRRGFLKKLKLRRIHEVYYRRRDLERVKAVNLRSYRPPAGLLGVADVAEAIEGTRKDVERLIALGRLRVAARRESGGRARGFDPEEVRQIAKERGYIASLVGTNEASRILGLGRFTLGKLARRGVVAPQAFRGRVALYEPAAVRAMRDDPRVVEARRRIVGVKGAHRPVSQRGKRAGQG